MNQVQVNHTPSALPAPGRMSIRSVSKGKIKKPMRVVLFGPEKIGKSSFAAGARNPVFLGSEDGTSELDVARFPEPRTWTDALSAVRSATDDDHDHQTFVIDTADWLEPFIWADVCQKAGKASIDQMAYGSGYSAALDQWRILLSRLDALRAQRGMDVIILAHSNIRTFKNPTGDDYDRYELKVHSKASGLMKEWADCVLFTNYETFTVKKGDGPLAKARGVSDGARIIYTTRTAAWDAGNRYGLPPTLPLSWDDFAEAVVKGAPVELEKVLAEVESLLGKVDSETAAKARAWIGSGNNSKDPIKLSQLADRLRGRVLINNDNESTKEESKS